MRTTLARTLLFALAAPLVACSTPEPEELCMHYREIAGNDTSNIEDRAQRLRGCVDHFTQVREQNPDAYEGFSSCIMSIETRNDSTDNRIEGCNTRFPIR